MSAAVSTSVSVVAYLALFAAIGIIFLLANLILGRFVRPANPTPEKLEVYECGEPAIGSSFIQFDLRFYVVALLFIIFDVEVAFFFPWATVFGKSSHLMDPRFQVVAKTEQGMQLTDSARYLYREMGVQSPRLVASVPASLSSRVTQRADEATFVEDIAHSGGRQLALLSIVDILLFFVVLLVGFAYVWWRGDLDWVRAVGRERFRGDSGLRVSLRDSSESCASA